MSRLTALCLSSLLVISPVVFAQSQTGGTAGSAGGATSGAAGSAAGAASGAAAGAAAAGITVGVATAAVAAVAVVASALADKSDPVYTTTNSGTGTKSVCIAHC